MIFKFPHIELFFKQKSFSQEDLDFFKVKVDKFAISEEDRRAQQSSVSMHLLAYSMGTTLKESKSKVEPQKKEHKKKSERPLKKTTEQRLLERELIIQNRKPSIVNRPVDAKTEARRQQARERAVKAREKLKKSTVNNKVVDKATLSIRETLKARGMEREEDEIPRERHQTFRGSKSTFVKIIYTRM